MLLKAVFISSVLSLTVGTSYDGYKVYKVTAVTETENDFLQSLQQDRQFDFWSKINKVGNPVTIMASPQVQEKFEQELNTRKINYFTEIENVQRTIESEQKYHRTKSLPKGRISFDQYLRQTEINDYLDQLAEEYPNLVTVSTIGRSYENRTMKIIRIASNHISKPVIFIEAGMHAREWISPALALYIVEQLVVESDPHRLLEGLDWIILPSMNPDGYDYTWTTDRFWRKTRSPGARCDGTDGNRNFGFHWMELGASSNECSETFAGRYEFSEVEARNLRTILDATKNIVAFVSLHSYGQYLFYPYSYDYVVPANWQLLDRLARSANDAIRAVNGTQYDVGSSTELLYPAAGCSDDWAMGGAFITTVLTFELPGGGRNGFDLPPERILPVVTETWEGIKVIANYVRPDNK